MLRECLMLLEGFLVTSQLSVSCIRSTELEYVLLNNELTCHWGFKTIGFVILCSN